MKFLCLISGGIDSAVAAALALDQGFELEFVHFDNKPFNDGASLRKVEEIIALLSRNFNKKLLLHIVPHGNAQRDIVRNCERRLTCVLCRRQMFRAASMLAKKTGAGFLLTGESLGQVASQTLSNLNAESGSYLVPVARPLLGMDKNEITRLAYHFGTMQPSTRPGMCCELVPEKPATQAKKMVAESEEKNYDFKSIAASSIENTETREFGA